MQNFEWINKLVVVGKLFKATDCNSKLPCILHSVEVFQTFCIYLLHNRPL